MQKAIKKLFSTKILLARIPFELNFHCKVSFVLLGFCMDMDRKKNG